jgi:tetratricopeptide (TPR) repeat protein
MASGPPSPNNPNSPAPQGQEPNAPLAQRAKAAFEHLLKGDHRAAGVIAQELLREYPDRPAGYRIMAQISNHRGVQLEAVNWISQAIACNPNNAEFRISKSQFCHDAGQVEVSLEILDGILEKSPLFPRAQWRRILAYERLGRIDEAMELLDSMATTPASAHHESLRARIETRLGDTSMARDRLEHLLAQPSLKPRVRSDALFQLSRLCDTLGDYDAAFARAVEVNTAFKGNFDASAHQSQTNQLIEYFTPERFDTLPRSNATSDMPVYIIGLPRSGTSLIEQIIDAHPRAAGSGERREPLLIAEDLAYVHSQPFPQCLDQVSAEVLSSAGSKYIQMLASYGFGVKRVTNKSLGLDRIAGLLPLMTPGCRIIFVSRAPLDNLLSIYLHPLRNDRNPWAQSLDDLCHAWTAFDTLRQHWTKVLPCPCINISYESLVQNQRQTTEDLLAFLDLPWDDRCIAFHESKRSVMTPSYDQVNTAMNNKAIDRWRNYEKHLGTLLATFPPETDTAP